MLQESLWIASVGLLAAAILTAIGGVVVLYLQRERRRTVAASQRLSVTITHPTETITVEGPNDEELLDAIIAELEDLRESSGGAKDGGPPLSGPTEDTTSKLGRLFREKTKADVGRLTHTNLATLVRHWLAHGDRPKAESWARRLSNQIAKAAAETELPEGLDVMPFGSAVCLVGRVRDIHAADHVAETLREVAGIERVVNMCYKGSLTEATDLSHHLMQWTRELESELTKEIEP